MSTIRVELPINRPAQVVWPLLADFGSIDFFNPSVAKSRIINDTQPHGVGAERHCDFSDGKNWVRERVVDWTDGHSYRVEIFEGTMPISQIEGHLGVDPDGETSRGFMEMTYTPKFGVLGRVMDVLIMQAMMKKTMTGVLQGLAEKAEAQPVAVAASEAAAA